MSGDAIKGVLKEPIDKDYVLQKALVAAPN
jgi:hypothetical protein